MCAGWEAGLERAAKDDAERAALPEWPVVGPDGVEVVVSVGRTVAVDDALDGGDDPSQIVAWLLVKSWWVFRVLRVKPWTVRQRQPTQPGRSSVTGLAPSGRWSGQPPSSWPGSRRQA